MVEKRRKILYVHHGGAMGGAPKSLYYLIESIDKNKFDVVIWVMRNGPVVPMFEKLGVPVLISNSKWHQPFHGTTVSGISVKVFLKNILGYFPTYFFAKKLIKDIKPDIIHLTTSCLFHFAKAAKIIDKKILVVSHIREPLLPNFFGNILLNMNSTYVDRFIGISNNDAAPFIEYGNNVTVINNFVNVQEYKKDAIVRQEKRDELNIEEGEIVVSYFARISSSNGTLDFIKIARSLYSHKKIKFFIFGFEEDTPYAKEVKEKALGNVLFMPMVSNVADYLCASDILLSPFKTPHFSRAIIEAAAIGVPSIATNVGSQNELILNNVTGFLYTDNEEATEKILTLYNNEELRILLGENARKFAEDKFDAKKNAVLTFNCYE
jgi:glycosyltransferase involved in cell wall biosynthesis